MVTFLLVSSEINAQKSSSFISDFVQRSVFDHASLSVSAIEVNGSEEVLSYRSQKSMVPASSLKVLTTFTALDVLGDDYTFKTVIGYTGELLGDGTLEGDLIIIGSGDPSFGSNHFDGVADLSELLDQIVKAVKQAGITCISGHVIANDSYVQHPAVAPDWKWNDIANYYGAGAWGLNVHDNLYYIYFQQNGVEGKSTTIRRYGPKVPSIRFINEVRTGKKGSGDNAYIFGGPSNYEKTISGTIPPGSKEFFIKGAIPDPPLFFSFHLFHALKDQKIKVDGYTRSNQPMDPKLTFTEVKTYSSLPLIDIVKKTNEKSENIYAEALLNTLSKSGNDDQSVDDLMKSILTNHGLETSSLSVADGSGLSTSNLISTNLMAMVLKHYGQTFGLQKATSLLPLAGESGTVKYFLQKRSCKGRVWAKSGSMSGVLSYSGYVKTKSGKWLSFAVIVNGFTTKHRDIRRQLEDLVEHMYTEL